ncbi:MAG: lysophospholipid acyltransferase family protein [Pseudomonadota bacterium]|nr:lysophospholipid acyltransferase family protein [Pseudomonadota bacterium]
MTTLFRFLSILPLGLMQGVGWLLGWVVFLLSGVYRRRFLANAHQAGYGGAQWRGAVGPAGQLVAELPRLWLGRPVAIEWDGAQHIEAALALGRGIVFLTPHLGCFEITAQAYAQRFGQRQPMTVLFRPARQPWLRTLVATARSRPGLHTVPTTLAGVKQMLKALRQGQSVGLLPDQVPPLGLGVWAPFFGQPAYTMTLSARLAQQTGATVLVAWGERLSWGRGFRIHVRPLGVELPAEMTAAAAVINQAMAQLIAECPQQYLWGYARYKQPREEQG